MALLCLTLLAGLLAAVAAGRLSVGVFLALLAQGLGKSRSG